MEALEPVLKQKFWILLGMAVIMTFTGWWMATAAIAQQTSERMTKIKAAQDSVPKGEVPNESWTKRLAGINATQDASNNATKMSLWKRQLAKMTIPQGLDQTVPYQGKFTSEDREVFRDIYPEEVRKVWKMLNPMDLDGSGVVDFPLSSMFKLMNQKPWILSAPKSEVIWDIMEDLWLLEGLFQSITEVNGGLEATRMEAVVHQIDKLELHGGGEKLSSGGATGAASAEGPMGSFAMSMPSMGAMGGPGGAGAGGASGMTPVSAEFDIKEEFGDDGSTASSGLRGGGSMSSMMMSMGASGEGGGGMPAATAEPVVKRYVSDEPAKPFKTRGFYLSVKMDHRRIPQLIAELTANDKSVWPVEIVRVQMSRLHEDDSLGGGAGSMRSGRSFPGAMGSDESSGSAMAAQMAQGALGAFPGGGGGFPGGGGGGADEFAGFTSNTPGGAAAAKSPQAMLAQSVLENTLKDPYMAQVTICGFFTMYRKVEEPEAKPAPTSPENPSSPEVKSEGTEASGQTADMSADSAPAGGAEIGSEPPEDAGKTASEMPAEESGDQSDDPAAKGDDEKPKENPNPDGELK